MDTHLAMNGVKTSSFSVKDLLDLPESKDGCSPVTGVGSPGELLVAAAAAAAAGEVGPAPPSYYDQPDNPYTRWLHHNSEALHYNSKLEC